MPLVPEGIPAAMKLSVAARVLNLQEATVRGWADRGELETVQLRSGAMRYVASLEIARVAQLFGVKPDWATCL